MSDETTYKIILKLLRKRLSQALSMSDAQLPIISMAELINVLFALHGTWGTIGDYTATFNGLTALIGDDFWKNPTKVPGPAQVH
jgi:hypothetical protein